MEGQNSLSGDKGLPSACDGRGSNAGSPSNTRANHGSRAAAGDGADNRTKGAETDGVADGMAGLIRTEV